MSGKAPNNHSAPGKAARAPTAPRPATRARLQPLARAADEGWPSRQPTAKPVTHNGADAAPRSNSRPIGAPKGANGMRSTAPRRWPNRNEAFMGCMPGREAKDGSGPGIYVRKHGVEKVVPQRNGHRLVRLNDELGRGDVATANHVERGPRMKPKTEMTQRRTAMHGCSGRVAGEQERLRELACAIPRLIQFDLDFSLLPGKRSDA